MVKIITLYKLFTVRIFKVLFYLLLLLLLVLFNMKWFFSKIVNVKYINQIIYLNQTKLRNYSINFNRTVDFGQLIDSKLVHCFIDVFPIKM